MKNKKKKLKKILIEKLKAMNKKTDFKRNCHSRTAEGIDKIGHDISRIMKWLTHYDRSYYINDNYYDLRGFVLKTLGEIS